MGLARGNGIKTEGLGLGVMGLKVKTNGSEVNSHVLKTELSNADL